MAQGSSAGLNSARGLTDTLILLIATGVGVAIYPFFSDMTAAQDRAALGDALMRSLRLMMFVFIPITVALILLRTPLVQLAFEGGKFTADSVAMTVQPLTFYAIGLTAFAVEIILMRLYLSMKNTLTPALVGAFCVLIHWGVILLFKDTLHNGSMALATTLSKTAKVAILFVMLAPMLPCLQWRRNGIFLVKALTGAAGMAAVMFLVLKVSSGYLDGDSSGKLVRFLLLAIKMGLAGGAGLCTFILLAHAFGMDETRDILAIVKRRRMP
jgi:putative peptidoglycan lipid II flippase